jgi:ribose 5-phosphate isomerase A
MPDLEREKELAAEASLAYIEEGMAVGLGSGSTARHFVRLLGERVRAGLSIRGISTSRKTDALAREVGIPLTTFQDVQRLDVTVDGADEIDPQLNLIKGGGGALLREKIVAAATEHFIIVADSRKPVSALGAFPLPVEVIPFGWQNVARSIRELGADVELRRSTSGEAFVTAEQNYILDCYFGRIWEPQALGIQLRDLIGVVEHGLFVGLTDLAIIGRGNVTETIRRRGHPETSTARARKGD